MSLKTTNNTLDKEPNALIINNDSSDEDCSDDEISEVDSDESSDDESDDEIDLGEMTEEDYNNLDSEDKMVIHDIVENLSSEAKDKLANLHTKKISKEPITSFFEANIPQDVLQGAIGCGWDDPIASQGYLGEIISNPLDHFIIGASTGSGKTGCFGIALASLIKQKIKCPQAMIIVPNKTLAKPIFDVICELVKFTKISVALHRGAGPARENGMHAKSTPFMSNDDTPPGFHHINVCTPGKARALLNPDRDVHVPMSCVSEKSLRNNRTHYSDMMNKSGKMVRCNLFTMVKGEKICTIKQLAVDECDEVLKHNGGRNSSSMAEDFEEIISRLHPECRYLLYSATASSSHEVRAFMSKFSGLPGFLQNSHDRELAKFGYHGCIPHFLQITVNRSLDKSISHTYVVPRIESEKTKWLLLLLNRITYNTVFIFCNSNVCVDTVFNAIKDDDPNFPVNVINQNVDQDDKDELLKQFAAGTFRAVVTTDICARGIDIASTDLVINFEIPHFRSIDQYPHRAGRAGRLNKKGSCINICSPYESTGIPPDIKMLIDAFNINITVQNS